MPALFSVRSHVNTGQGGGLLHSQSGTSDDDGDSVDEDGDGAQEDPTEENILLTTEFTGFSRAQVIHFL